MDHGYYIGAKEIIILIREKLAEKLDSKTFELIDKELEKIEKELDYNFFISKK